MANAIPDRKSLKRAHQAPVLQEAAQDIDEAVALGKFLMEMTPRPDCGRANSCRALERYSAFSGQGDHRSRSGRPLRVMIDLGGHSGMAARGVQERSGHTSSRGCAAEKGLREILKEEASGMLENRGQILAPGPVIGSGIPVTPSPNQA